MKKYVKYEMPELKPVDCNNCKNNNTKWCGGCEYRSVGVDNYDFYRPIK